MSSIHGRVPVFFSVLAIVIFSFISKNATANSVSGEVLVNALPSSNPSAAPSTVNSSFFEFTHDCNQPATADFYSSLEYVSLCGSFSVNREVNGNLSLLSEAVLTYNLDYHSPSATMEVVVIGANNTGYRFGDTYTDTTSSGTMYGMPAAGDINLTFIPWNVSAHEATYGGEYRYVRLQSQKGKDDSGGSGREAGAGRYALAPMTTIIRDGDGQHNESSSREEFHVCVVFRDEVPGGLMGRVTLPGTSVYCSAPGSSASPTVTPTAIPSVIPSGLPVTVPTAAPTTASAVPTTTMPTEAPTAVSTTATPTCAPSLASVPSQLPSSVPSQSPSISSYLFALTPFMKQTCFSGCAGMSGLSISDATVASRSLFCGLYTDSGCVASGISDYSCMPTCMPDPTCGPVFCSTFATMSQSCSISDHSNSSAATAVTELNGACLTAYRTAQDAAGLGSALVSFGLQFTIPDLNYTTLLSDPLAMQAISSSVAQVLPGVVSVGNLTVVSVSRRQLLAMMSSSATASALSGSDTNHHRSLATAGSQVSVVVVTIPTTATATASPTGTTNSDPAAKTAADSFISDFITAVDSHVFSTTLSNTAQILGTSTIPIASISGISGASVGIDTSVTTEFTSTAVPTLSPTVSPQLNNNTASAFSGPLMIGIIAAALVAMLGGFVCYRRGGNRGKVMDASSIPQNADHSATGNTTASGSCSGAAANTTTSTIADPGTAVRIGTTTTDMEKGFIYKYTVTTTDDTKGVITGRINL